MKVKIPKIGDTVTVEWGLDLCRYFQLQYLVDRIEAHPDKYRSWEFDGCSGVDDARILRFIFGDKWRIITFKCCLVHDLKYAYGDLDNEAERRQADKSFHIGGSQFLKASFSWGFASID